MFKRVASVLGLLLVGAIVFLIASVVMFGQGSAGCTLATGRSVSISANSWRISLESSKDRATIKAGGRTIVVAPDEATIDGEFAASIPPSAKAVDVQVQNGVVKITADGQPIESGGIETL